MDDCIFCKIIRDEAPSHKLWENDEFLAFLSNGPINPGHVLLVPKQHIDYVFDMEEPQYSTIFRHAQKLSAVIKKTFDAPRVGLVIEGFSVRHVHLHLVPVYNVAELDPNRLRPATLDDLAPIAERLVLAMNDLETD
ncbi:MAG: HIT family protein [Bacteroidetes bacterium]|nr:HIT family protein [Bacteroidota bacterium]